MTFLRRFHPALALPLAASLALGACGDDEPLLSDRDAGPVDAQVPVIDGGVGDAGPPPVDAGPECYRSEPTVPADPTAGAWENGYGTPGVGGDLPTVDAIAFGEGGLVYLGGDFTAAGSARARNGARGPVPAGGRAMGEGRGGRVGSRAVAPSGELFAAYAGNDPWEARRIARWDGTTWSDVASTDDPDVDPEGGWPLETDAIEEIVFVGTTLYVAGSFERIGGADAAGLARWDGTTWSGYAGLAPDGVVEAISATSDDDVCIGGSFQTLGVVDATYAACWNGTEWQARSTPLPFYTGVFDLARDPADGALVAVGEFMLEEPSDRGGSVARWETDHWELIGGGVMSELGPGTTQPVRAAVFAPSGMYVAGAFDVVNSEDPIVVRGVARWNGTEYEDIGGLWAEVGFIGPRNNVTVAAAAPDGSVYFGGLFTRGGGVRAAHVVRWDGTYWSPLRTPGERYEGVSGSVSALAREGTCHVYVGGSFAYAGTARANNIARYTPGVGYAALGEGVVGDVAEIEVLGGGRIAIGGSFTDETGTVFRNVAYWDGADWLALGGSVDGSVYALDHLPATSPDERELLYVGGDFQHAGELEAEHLAMWDGERWTAIGGGFQGFPLEYDPTQEAMTSVRAILRDPESGDLIVAGQFRSVGADERVVNNIARWDGEAWHAYGDGLGGLFDHPTSLGFDADGRLVAVGSFETSGDEDVRFVAVWTGSAWEQVGELALEPYGQPYELAVVGDALFVGGAFTLSGTSSQHIAAWNGTAWVPLAEGASDIVQAMLATDEGVFVGGTFDRTGTVQSVGLALWQYE